MNGQNTTAGNVSYELILSYEEAKHGIHKVLTRNGKRLQVSIPPNIKDGNVVKLGNALKITDNTGGDILIKIRVKAAETGAEGNAPAEVVVVTDSTFEKEVLSSSLPVVVDFWAQWCGPCRMMSPVLDRAAAQYRGKFKFCKINVDENPAMASRYKAMSIPLLVFYKNGSEIDRSVGAIPENQLKSKLDALI